MKLKFLNILLLMLFTVGCKAEELVANVPSKVALNDNFHLTYTIASQDVGDLRLGNLPSGLELITGPYRSSQSSYQMINGHASSSSSTTFTFILCGVKEGVFKIPSATVLCGGRKYVSKPLTVKVSSHGKQSSTSQSSESVSDYRGGNLKSSDLFIKVNANKSEVYEQEPVLLTYKVYTLVGLNELNGKMPDLKGFHTLEIPMPQQKSFHVESLNGKQYKCITWSQYLMYPQLSGRLDIPSIDFIGTVVQRNHNVDPIEALFNGGSDFVEVKRKIVAPGLTLNVLPLPTRPNGFSGGVGSFKISAQINSASIKSNEPFTLRVVISGKGNLKLIKAPTIDLPKDFDKYDPKLTDKTKVTENGLEGNVIYDYVIVPRNHGKYTIPAINFIFFNTQSRRYETIKTQSFELDVEKGESDGSGVNDYNSDLRNKDICKLKKGDYNVVDKVNLFFGSTSYYLSLAFVFIVGMILVFCQKNDRIHKIVSGRTSNGTPSRQALKHLSKANAYKLQGDTSMFYEEVLKCLWGYASEKFGLSSAELNRDKLLGKFEGNGIGKDVSDLFFMTLDSCEFARYAPTESSFDTNKIFEDAMNCLTTIEKELKMKKKKSVSSLLILSFVLFSFTPAFSSTKENADKEYEKGNYQQAIAYYLDILKTNKSPEVYYNLGNAYYRTDNLTKSILSYERALKLSPADDDILFNLRLAQSKTIDKVVSPTDIFLVRWYNGFVCFFGIDCWAGISIFCLGIFFVLFVVFLKARKMRNRKIAFSLMSFIALLFILSVSSACRRLMILSDKTGAVVVAPVVQLKSVPDEKGEDATVIHEGTKVEILDSSMKNWLNVKLPDERQGWIRAESVELI